MEKKEGQEEVEVEGDDVLFFHLHRLLRIAHLLASPEGGCSHTGDLLSLFFLSELSCLVARREAFVEKMGLVEEAWRLGAPGLVGSL